jgi:hypothetical protein
MRGRTALGLFVDHPQPPVRSSEEAKRMHMPWHLLFAAAVQRCSRSRCAGRGHHDRCIEGWHPDRLGRSGRGPRDTRGRALCSRAFGPSRKLAALLAEHLTVYITSPAGRRKRRHQGRTPRTRSRRPRALGRRGGGSARCSDSSSGEHCARRGCQRRGGHHVVAYEPPYVDDEERAAEIATRGRWRARAARRSRRGVTTS